MFLLFFNMTYNTYIYVHNPHSQFLLSFMLNFKKKEHSIYSFIRNEQLFNNLNKYDHGINDDIILHNLRNIIFSQSISQFSLYFEHLSLTNKYYILKNEDTIYKLLKSNEWKKGIELFNIVCKNLKNNDNTVVSNTKN